MAGAFSTKTAETGRINVTQCYKDTYGSVENLITVAKNGHIDAQADLGMAYSEGVEDFVEKDFQKAAGWLSTAIDSGYVHPFVFTRFGELLELEGAPQHQRKAYEMYHRAAKLGSAAAQLDLAEMYRCGVEGVVNKDLNEAFEWYKKAADESAFDDNIEVGTMRTMDWNAVKLKALKVLYLNYLGGDCPEGQPQLTKAVYYLTRAAELGDNEAQRDLGKIYLTGSCEQIKDVRKARRWLEKAAFGGDVMAKQVSCDQ